MDKTIINFLDEVAGASKTLSERTVVQKNDSPFYSDVAIFFLYVKSVKTYRSIVMLLENDRHEDAQILLRTLLENMFVSFWLQQKGKISFLRFWRFELLSKQKAHYKSLWKTINKREPINEYLDSETDTFEKLKEINELLVKMDQSFNLKLQENQYDSKGWWAGISTETLAKEISNSLKSDYYKWQYDIPFSMVSNFVHPNPITIWDYLSGNSDNSLRANFSTDQDNIVSIALLASVTMLDLMHNLDERFCLEAGNLINQLNQKSVKMFNQST